MWLSTPVDGGESRGKTIEVNMPDVAGGQDILDMLGELGFFTSSAGIPVGHTFTEIESYSRMTGVQLSPWESLQLVNLSNVAAQWFERSKSKTCSNPLGSKSEKAETRQERINNLIFG